MESFFISNKLLITKERNNNYLFKNLLIRDLINIFARDNHLFDSRRFESACYDE